MKTKNAPSLKKISHIFLSFFGFGLVPIAPGTFGSLGAMIVIYFFPVNTQWKIVISIISIALFFIAARVIDKVQEELNAQDPGWIVIDEVLGIFIAWLFFSQSKDHITQLIICFIAFRFFDITKIFPASYFDKSHSGMSVMMDDIIAGLYAGLIILASNTLM